MQDNFKPRIKQIYLESDKYLKSWEKEFFMKEGRESTFDDMNIEVRHIFNKKKHSKTLMKHWSIK